MATAGFQYSFDFRLQSLTIDSLLSSIRHSDLPPHFKRALAEMSKIELRAGGSGRRIDKAICSMLEKPGGRKTGVSFPSSFASKLLKAVDDEFHDFVCNKSAKYKGERKALTGSLSAGLVCLSAKIGSVLGISGAWILAALYALMMLLLKIGRNAYCKLRKS